jgi:hypothetical protein
MNKIKLLLGLSISMLIANSTFADGSYMFCVNANNTNDWTWAPPLSSDSYLVKTYPNVVQADSKGTWINGIGGINTHVHSILNILDYFGDDPSGFPNFCNDLVRLCQNAYGQAYKYVGVSGYAVAEASWSYIAYQISKNNVCPNWNYPDGEYN